MKLTGVFCFLALTLPVVLSFPTRVRRDEGSYDGSTDYGKSGDGSSTLTSTSTSADGSGSWATTTTTTTTLSTSFPTSTWSESTWTSTSSSFYPSETGSSSSSSSSASVATCEFDRSTGDVICEAASSSSSGSTSGSSNGVDDEGHSQSDGAYDQGEDGSNGGESGTGSNGESTQGGSEGSNSSSCSSSSFGYGNDEWRDSDVDQDIRLLNLALSVSHMSQSFYNQSLCAYSNVNFTSEGYPSWVRNRYEEIKEHQDEHVAFLYKAITAAGRNAVMECRYDFAEVNDAKTFVELSETIETIAASAFNGLVKHIRNEEYRTLISSIMATQARHATWINSAVRHKNPWSTAYETPITLNMTFSLMNDFIVPGSCPSSNDISTTLPHDLVNLPSLELPERIKAGHKTSVWFNASDSVSDADGSEGARHYHNEKDLYAAFMSGTETYYEKVWEESGEKYVMVPEEVKAKGAVYIVIVDKHGEHEKDEDSPSSSPSASSSSGSGSGVSSSSSSSASSSTSGSENGNDQWDTDDGEHYDEERNGDNSVERNGSNSISSSSASSASSGGPSSSSYSSSSASSSGSGSPNVNENNDLNAGIDNNTRRRRRFEHHTVVAGPALVMFPFNSEGKPVVGLRGGSGR